MEHTLPYGGIQCVRSLPISNPEENHLRCFKVTLRVSCKIIAPLEMIFWGVRGVELETPVPPSPPPLNTNLLMISSRSALSGSRLQCAARGGDTCRHTLQTGLLSCGLEHTGMGLRNVPAPGRGGLVGGWGGVVGGGRGGGETRVARTRKQRTGTKKGHFISTRK